MECETSRSSDGHFETRVYEPRVPIDARHGLGSPFTRDGSQEGASPPSNARTANRPRRLAPKLVYARSFPRSSLLADHDTPPHRPQLEAYRRAKERRAEEAIRRARERRAGAPVPLEEHAANDRARRVPTADSGASSSGWRRASVAGQSSRRGRDRACERTVADISSLRAFTGLLDAAADDDDDDDDVRVDAGANGLPERRVGSDGEPRRVRATDAESTENDRLSSENARLREEVARLEGMVDALMMLVDRHGIDASGTGQTKDDAESGDLKSGDLESGDDEEDEEAPPIGDCDSMLEHWLRNHCVPAAAERLSGEREGTPVSAATRTGGVDEDDGEHAERALADSPFEYHAGDEREGEARKMPEEFAKGKITAKKEEALTPEAPTRVMKTFS